MCAVRAFGTDEEKSILEGDIETAYLEKEIERIIYALSSECAGERVHLPFIHESAIP